MPDVVGVKPPKPVKSENYRSQLLAVAASVGPLPSAYQLPEPLILRHLVPLLAHALTKKILKHLHLDREHPEAATNGKSCENRSQNGDSEQSKTTREKWAGRNEWWTSTSRSRTTSI
ncbi:hypothetical protein ACFX2I_006304 [Malus domestica]